MQKYVIFAYNLSFLIIVKLWYNKDGDNMKKLAVISEFNPFHNGHKYLLERARKLTKSDILICIMSGDFVQRGEACLIDKFKRANSAIDYADLIIEMPSFVTLQGANFFAYKNVEILNKLGIDYLAFGIENIDEKSFLENANLILENDSLIDKKIRKLLDKGLSFTKASYLACQSIVKNQDFLSSNNVLALEYLRAIKKINKDIKPCPIKRKGSQNKDENLREGFFSSSTSIRNNINDESIRKYLTDKSYGQIKSFEKDYNFPDFEYFYKLFRYKILIEKNDMATTLCYENGLDNLLYNLSKDNEDYISFIKNATSLRFTKSRIKRLILNYLLNNEIFLNDIDINFVKILAFNKKSTKIMKNKDINFIIKKKDSEKLNKENKLVYKKMIDSSNLYSLAINRDLDYDFSYKLSIKKSS